MIPKDALNRLHNSELEVIKLRCGEQEVSFTLQGAHVVSYLYQGIERLWLSPKSLFEANKPIRGGVPICWPWFGAHPEDQTQPAHGFARTQLWELNQLNEGAEHASALLTFTSPNPDYRLKAEYLIELTESQLSLSLTTTNLDEQPYVLTEALHTYLPVSDLDTASLHGLEQTDYSDKLQNYAMAAEEREAIYLSEPTDRVYFESGENLHLIDAGWGRTTTISKSGSGATVVWNAGQEIAAGMADLGAENYRGYVCVEAANALSAAVTLDPGTSHTITQTLSFR